MKEKVIIIGAGPAGLTMAYQILKDGKDKYNVVTKCYVYILTYSTRLRIADLCINCNPFYSI